MVTNGAVIALLIILCVTAPMNTKGWTRHWAKASAFFFIAGIITLLKDLFT